MPLVGMVSSIDEVATMKDGSRNVVTRSLVVVYFHSKGGGCNFGDDMRGNNIICVDKISRGNHCYLIEQYKTSETHR
jgi:hypothetical protein